MPADNPHRRRSRLALLLILLAVPVLAGCKQTGASADPGSAKPPAAASGTAPADPPQQASLRPKHVFVIVLENKGYSETFGPDSPAPYLSKQLTSQGELLSQYYGIGHNSLDNYIALISGQAPNPQTQADCQVYSDFVGAPVLGPDGQAIGQGCVYPPDVKTLAGPLQEAGLTWGAYLEDMGNSATQPDTCRHPALNSQDNTQSASVGDQYAARHNPFVYFHSIIDSNTCARHDVPLKRLPQDLQSVKTTPNFVFIAPNLCHDGHDSPCVDGEPGGLVSADDFLRQWIPVIRSSPAYQLDGMIVILFDEAEFGNSNTDASACCNEQPGPDSPLPGIVGPGGGRTGALILSQYVVPGSVNDTPYNHYAFLKSVEQLFGLGYLGYAGQSGLKAFGGDVYNRQMTP
ncbi:MAG TPA: alkaline phosphatase family protein [Gammaproteobacteria bacterium]|nr:alkaline phosphatase family protein [Gammaproteobacteria bacterium]